MQTIDGKKLLKGSVVRLEVPDVAKPLYFHLQKAVLQAGMHPMGFLIPSDDETYNFTEQFFTYATKAQREFFPETYTRAAIDQIDGRIRILADTHPNALANVDPKLVMQKAQAGKLAKDLMLGKANEGKLAWSLGVWGTPVAAKAAGLSERAYWQEIINACYLDHDDPVQEWRRIDKTVKKIAKKLNTLKIDSLHVVGPDVDLVVGIGANRAWQSGGGSNVPSYEVFTSPDHRRVNGWIRFNQPLRDRYGNTIRGIELQFKGGVCTKATADENQAALTQLLKTPGGNRLGEFSLTEARLSRITKFMANTVYDENVGGKYGNMHVAIGSAYRDCFQGVNKPTTDKEWDALGYNDSVVHEDIVSTTPRSVTATFDDGSTRVIYKDGAFLI